MRGSISSSFRIRFVKSTIGCFGRSRANGSAGFIQTDVTNWIAIKVQICVQVVYDCSMSFITAMRI